VLHTKGGSGTDWGTKFGDFDVIIQSAGNNWAWGDSQTKFAGVSFERGADKDVFVVLDITKVKTYDTFISNGGAKFIIQYGSGQMNIALGLQAGYLYYQALTKPATGAEELLIGADVGGFVTTENLFGLTLPTTFYTVSFTEGIGSPAVADVKVGAGSSLGVQFPTWVKKAGYIFLGWFNNGNQYTEATPITSDINLTANWEEVPIPTLPSSMTQVNLNVQNGTGVGLGEGGEYGDGEYDIDLFTGSKYIVFYFQGNSASGNADGWGGTQVVVQSNIVPGDWYQSESSGWTSFANAGNADYVYYVVKLDTLMGYNVLSVDTSLTGVKIILNYGFNECLAAWVTDAELPVSSYTAHIDSSAIDPPSTYPNPNSMKDKTKSFYLTKDLGLD